MRKACVLERLSQQLFGFRLIAVVVSWQDHRGNRRPHLRTLVGNVPPEDWGLPATTRLEQGEDCCNAERSLVDQRLAGEALSHPFHIRRNTAWRSHHEHPPNAADHGSHPP